MKYVSRNFIITIPVPDGIDPDDCEITVEPTAAYTLSYDMLARSYTTIIPIEHIIVGAEEPYTEE